MKFRVTLKDPDGFSEGVSEAVAESIVDLMLTTKEKEAVRESREENTWEALEKWVDCQEYVTLEFDTEAGTATVVKR